jgi:hypothetical protein
LEYLTITSLNQWFPRLGSQVFVDGLSYENQCIRIQQCTYKRNIEKLSINHCCSGIAMGITYSECVCLEPCLSSLRRRMLRITLSSVACLVLLHFSKLSHKRYDFRKKSIEYEVWVLIFSTTFVYNISHSKKNSARYYHKCTLVFI